MPHTDFRAFDRPRSRRWIAIALIASTGLLRPATAAAQNIPAGEYAARRHGIMSRLSDGIVLLHARSEPAEEDQWGFVQDPSFYYFTGLANVPEAILALDGSR